MGKLAEFVMRGRYQALLSAGIIGGLAQLMLPLALLSSAIVALYILRKGDKEGILVLFGAAVIIMMISFFVPSRPGLEFPLAIILLLPVYLCATILRLSAAPGLMVTMATACAVILAIAIQVVSGDAVAWWSDWLKIAVQGVDGASYQGFEDNNSIQYINGLIAMLLSMATCASLFIARWMQAKLYYPGAFSQEFQLLQTPKKIIYLIVVMLAIAAILNRNLMYDLAIISTTLYFFQGLAVLHYNAARQKGSPLFYLVPPYLVLTFVPHYGLLGFACVGVTDLWFNYRKLPNKKD
jgi:hypothetical protein